MRLRVSSGATALGVGAVLFAAPAAAPAATTCDYASQVLQVEMEGQGDVATLSVAGGGEIVVSGFGGVPIACAGGSPTVTNTNAISVFNHPGSRANPVVISGAGDFQPGATLETGSDEIEIFPTLNDAPDSVLRVTTAASGGAIRFGDGGINPNVSGEDPSTPDADIFPVGVPTMEGFGNAGPDALSAQGGAGTGNALTAGILLDGGAGPDGLIGGEGADALLGVNGSDGLFGMGGGDTLYPGPAGDHVDGGPGTDGLDYGDHAAGVSVDLAIAGPQSTGASGSETLSNVENVSGTIYPDVLRGDEGPNRLDGFVGGDDELVGRGGVDTLIARGGADTLDVRDGGPDSADCGTETDMVTADEPGTDTLTACENVLFPVSPPVPTAATAGGTGGDLTPARLTGYKLSRRVFSRATTVRFRLSEAATVRFTVERLRRGRYRKLKGSFKRIGRRGRNKFTFRGRLRGRKLRPGRYRLVATATDAARNRSKPKRVKFRIVER